MKLLLIITNYILCYVGKVKNNFFLKKLILEMKRMYNRICRVNFRIPKLIICSDNCKTGRIMKRNSTK